MPDTIDATVQDRLKQAEGELAEAKRRVAELRRKLPPMEIGEYLFHDGDGNEVQLSSLFGNRTDLMLIHNMGMNCPYCTLWADGFEGFRKHIENRSALALVSPDKPSVMKQFVADRGWSFRTLSGAGNSFARDMEYEDDKGKPMPGVSTFTRDADGTIYRVGTAPFGPGDDFCSIWHLFELLADGVSGWQPKYKY